MTKCKECRESISKKERFCWNCGKENDEFDIYLRCPNCFWKVKEKDKYCRGCGTEIIIEKVGTKFCPGCGKKVPKDLKYCTKCGEKQ